MWVDLFSEVRENGDGLKVLSDKDQKKLVFTLQTFICELSDMDSISESEFNFQSSMLCQGNQLKIQEIKSEYVNLISKLETMIKNDEGVKINNVGLSNS